MKKLLAIRFSAMGDVAMTLPILYAAARQYPDIDFTLLTRERFTQLALQAPENLHFRGIDLKQYDGITGLFRLFRELKAEGFDAVADLHDVLRTKVLRQYFRMAGVRVGIIKKGRDSKKQLCELDERTFLHKYPEAHRQLLTSFERYRKVLRELGLDVEPNFESMLPAAAERKGIGIAPFAQHPGKIYPRMEQVVELLSQQTDEDIILFGGGQKEVDTLNSWASKYPHVRTVAGQLTLPEELQLMSTLRVMVTMDSANMHMASLVGTRVISIWGATHPYAGFLGWHQQETDCVQLDLPCRPCSVFGNKPCPRKAYPCLDINPQSVVNKIIDKD